MAGNVQTKIISSSLDTSYLLPNNILLVIRENKRNVVLILRSFQLKKIHVFVYCLRNLRAGMGWNVSNCHLITDKLPLGSVDLFCFVFTTIVSLTYYREIVG